MIKLIEIDGKLYLPSRKIVTFSYPHGNFTTFPWPLKCGFRNEHELMQQLREGLCEDRKEGFLPGDTKEVELPDGMVVGLDGHGYGI